MKKLVLTLSMALGGQFASLAQTAPSSTAPGSSQPPTARQQPRPVQPRLDLSDYGISIDPDPRLIVMMTALDIAGWDPTLKGDEASIYRQGIRRDLQGLDPLLRQRMKDFYERHRLKHVTDNPSTPEDETTRYTAADQAAAYVSLAYTLGPAPRFEAPPRSDDLPAGVLDVLDFVTLLREFYQKSGMDTLLPQYGKMHRAAGDSLRAPVLEMARGVLSYLNTRPETLIIEKVDTSAPEKGSKSNKQPQKKLTLTREQERRFVITPDLLAAPGAINLRVIAEDYFAITHVDTNDLDASARRRAPELRRAYMQYVLDPLMLRFSRDIAGKRAEIKQVIDAEAARTRQIPSPDVFLTVSRSLVAAADVRMDETTRQRVLQIETSNRLKAAKDDAARTSLLNESKAQQQLISDSATAQLADSYERGAVLSFFFADQLRGVEGSGFDIATFIPNMIAAIDAAREKKRPSEFAEAVARNTETRRKAQQARANESAVPAPADPRRATLIKSLSEVDELLKLKNYDEAEARLAALRSENKEEPRIYFALGQVVSLSAQEAFDAGLQQQRLVAALGHFRQALLFASPETDRSVILRAHLASGRILAHLERKEEAAKEFDSVIGQTEATDTLHQQALAEKRKLTTP
jgi:hypothetical protein